jgi:general secretion pathway protein K
MKRQGGEEGMILVNVLMFVAIASGIVMLMISHEDSALQRSTRLREVARAEAIARGGEASAIVALRRDALTGPDSDNQGEAWARIGDKAVAIEGGTFSLAIADAQGRFNVNSVMSGELAPVEMLGRVGLAAGLTLEQIAMATAAIRLTGPITDLRPLARAGLDPAVLARLAPLVTALPYDSKVNLNAVSEPLLAILLDDPLAAAALVAVRTRQGFLTSEDFASAHVPVPRGAGFTSNLFRVRTRVTIGDTSLQRTSLLARRIKDGQATVVPLTRWRGDAGDALLR